MNIKVPLKSKLIIRFHKAYIKIILLIIIFSLLKQHIQFIPIFQYLMSAFKRMHATQKHLNVKLSSI